VIQRPRIQTSQAKAASFFVGQTVPYVTGSTYGSAYGNSSSYSQLSVGVSLDVTPFINPDGLVVMDIQQEIDDIASYTTIDGNPVPNTSKRTLSSEIAVRDRDTIILGGFVRSDKSKSKQGVPLLMDIPLLGNLFTSRSDSKNRTETIVMIRPTVLKTPEIAAAQAVKEQHRLPGIAHAAAEDAESERKQVEAERRAELRRAKAQGYKDDRFNPLAPNTPVDTNSVSSPNP
jgi:general secretion pathway protein D